MYANSRPKSIVLMLRIGLAIQQSDQQVCLSSEKTLRTFQTCEPWEFHQAARAGLPPRAASSEASGARDRTYCGCASTWLLPVAVFRTAAPPGANQQPRP